MQHAYSHNLHKTTISVLGPMTPPLGGVSVHIERVIVKLKKQKNTIHHFDSTSQLRYRFFVFYLLKLTYFLFSKKPDYAIYHTTYLINALPELRLITYLKKILNFKLLLIEHDCRFVYRLSEKQQKKYQHILDHTDKQICIGSRTLASFNDVPLFCAKRAVESAFLPPDVSNRDRLLKEYPPDLFAFFKKHTPIILANAFQLSYVNGKDLYGFDQLVAAFAMYKKDVLSAGLILMLAQKGDVQLYEKLEQQIAKNNLTSSVYILLGNRVLWPLFEYADLFVRPTLSDGASVSVQEALYFKVPVVASDVCWRPEECKLYETGDYEALYQAINCTLS